MLLRADLSVLCGLWVALHAVVLQAVNSTVTEPYMDEEFHFRQTSAYCNRNYTYWDNKITTLPGLYLVGAAVTRELSGEGTCTLSNLRVVNAAFNLGNLVIVYLLISATQTHGKRGRSAVLLQSLVACTLPTHFFFGFLYYSDPGGLFFVLVMVLCAKYQSSNTRESRTASMCWQLLGAASGLCAVLFRQTNVLWVAFTVGMLLLDEFQRGEATDKITPGKAPTVAILSEMTRFLVFVLRSIPWVLVNCLFHLVVLGLFVVFLKLNGGIVLGDKSNHQVSLHLAQLMYFAAFSLVFSGAWAPPAGRLHGVVGFIRTHPISTAAVATFAIGSVHVGTIVHPFLLADNRHYTFYLWQRFFLKHEAAKYVPIPVYIGCILALWLAVRRSQDAKLWVAIFAVGLGLSVTLTPLVEFRYFTVPFFLLTAKLAPAPNGYMVAMLGFNSLVNAVTLYVFLEKPFTAPDGSVGRFMW